MSVNKENSRSNKTNFEFEEYVPATPKTISFKDVKMPISPQISFELEDGTPYVPNTTNINKKNLKETKSSMFRSNKVQSLTTLSEENNNNHNNNNNNNECKSEQTDQTFDQITDNSSSSSYSNINNANYKNNKINDTDSTNKNNNNNNNNNETIKLLKQELNEKNKEISQLRQLVSGININDDNTKSNQINNTILKKSGEGVNNNKHRKVSFSHVYTVLEGESDNNKHYITKTVESPSLLRHNRPGTPHPKNENNNNKSIGSRSSIAAQQRRKLQEMHAEINDPTYTHHSISTRKFYRTTPMPNNKSVSRLVNRLNGNDNSIDNNNTNDNNNNDVNHLKAPKVETVSKYDGNIKPRPNYLTPAKIHYEKLQHDDLTPKNYDNLVYALTPGSLDTEKPIDYKKKFNGNINNNNSNKIGETPKSIAKVSSQLDDVIQATETIRGTMSRLPNASNVASITSITNEIPNVADIVSRAKARSAQIDANIERINNNNSNLNGNNPSVDNGSKNTFEFDWTKKNDKKKQKGFSFMKH